MMVQTMKYPSFPETWLAELTIIILNLTTSATYFFYFIQVNFNKDWTLMCCSTNGINHNYLHFYKNEGYNLEYSLISRV